MNDEPMDETMSEPSPDDAHIRALLAELGSGPDGRPMPPEVAARLDHTLARLVAERAGSPEASPESSGDPDERASTADNVVPFRRRWVPRATAAAAAVVVLGAGSVAVANLGILGTGPSMSSDSAAGRSSDEKVAREGADGGSVPNATPSSPTSGDTALIPESTTADSSALPEISATSFESDVTTLLRRAPSDDASESPTSGDSGSGGEYAEKSTRRLAVPEEANEDAGQGPRNQLNATNCPGPANTDGVPNLVRYDGRLAVVVVHPEQDGRRLVEAWDCGGDNKLASSTITP